MKHGRNEIDLAAIWRAHARAKEQRRLLGEHPGGSKVEVDGHVVASPYDNWGRQPSFEPNEDLPGTFLNWYAMGPHGMLVPYPVGLAREMREKIEQTLQG